MEAPNRASYAAGFAAAADDDADGVGGREAATLRLLSPLFNRLMHCPPVRLGTDAMFGTTACGEHHVSFLAG